MKMQDLVVGHFDRSDWEYWAHHSVHHVPDESAPEQSIEDIVWPKGTYIDRIPAPVLVDGQIRFPGKEVKKVTFEVTTPVKEPAQKWVCFRFASDEEVALSWDSEQWTEVYYSNGRMSFGCISKTYFL